MNEPSASPATPRARRSCLSVPASSERMLEKAATSIADEVVIDLEDAVVPDEKTQARATAITALADLDWAPASLSVRINGLDTAWGADDIAALASAATPPGSIVVPKVEDADQLVAISADLNPGGGIGIGLQALIETARGLANVSAIAASDAGLETLILGYLDLSASLGRPRDAASRAELWGPARHQLLLAARANGLAAIDGPYPGVEVDDGFRAGVEHARLDGYDGKWAIHPAQIEALNQAFSPAEEDVDWAKRALGTLAEADAGEGRGAVVLEGEMIDEATRAMAMRVLARAGASA